MGGSALWTVLWTIGACCPALGSILNLKDEPLWNDDPPGPQWGMEEPVFGTDEFPGGEAYVHLDGARTARLGSTQPDLAPRASC